MHIWHARSKRREAMILLDADTASTGNDPIRIRDVQRE